MVISIMTASRGIHLSLGFMVCYELSFILETVEIVNMLNLSGDPLYASSASIFSGAAVVVVGG